MLKNQEMILPRKELGNEEHGGDAIDGAEEDTQIG